MREFVRKGLVKTRDRGADLSIITTLYGPPAYMTLQKKIRGRDIDPVYKEDLANYLVSWVKFLRETEKFPVNYVSLHNEGEDWERWPLDGRTQISVMAMIIICIGNQNWLLK
jgi:O-glycosyl hydrolase